MFIHQISDTQSCLISELSDETLKIVIEEKVKILSQYMKFALWTFQDTIESIASGMDMDRARRESKNKIQTWVQELWQYVLEAQVRWIDCSANLQSLFWRKEKSVTISYLLK